MLPDALARIIFVLYNLTDLSLSPDFFFFFLFTHTKENILICKSEYRDSKLSQFSLLPRERKRRKKEEEKKEREQ